MNILIIKNDGFGDLIIIKDLINKIDKKKFDIDIVLSKNNAIFISQLSNVKNKFVFDTLGSNFSLSKKFTIQDKKQFKKIKNKKYDLCVVLRRYLNTEQVAILNRVNTKKIILCHQFFNSKIKIKKKFIKVNIEKKYINDYDFFYAFLKKINLINFNNKIVKSIKSIEKNYLVLNLSGEKQFKNIDNLETLLKIIMQNYKHKIYVIGKTLDKEMRRKIKKKLISIKSKNLINLWSKTDFKLSMKIIKYSQFYVGFDTGLSHYASLCNKKSLILLNSGGANKWFPHSKTIFSNTCYLIYNTACAGCNFSGNLNKCYYKIRYCVDNIFLNRQKLNNNFKNFINNKLFKFTNYSDNRFISTDWNEKYKSIEFKYINKNGYLTNSYSYFKNFYYILKNFLILFNKPKKNLAIKILISNLSSFFYQIINR